MAKDHLLIRMRLTPPPRPIVFEFEMGEVYDLPRAYAEQFIATGMAELVTTKSPRLEAATLTAPSRRG